ncbi:MAG: hypothetical protein K6E79_06530 [Pseudobutyrivibrio sp.]|nr:hypothetical protein [Pseudobutyrivibrio sp.]
MSQSLDMNLQDPWVIENIVNVNNRALCFSRKIDLSGMFWLDEENLALDFDSYYPRKDTSFMRFSQLIYNEGKVYCIPRKGNTLDIYNIENKTWDSIEIKEPSQDLIKYPYSEDAKFSFSVIKDGKLFLFPETYPCIVCVNLETNTLIYLYDKMPNLIRIKSNNLLAFSTKGIIKKDNVIFYSRVEAALMSFDTRTHNISVVYKLNDSENQNRIMENDGDNIWLFPQNENGKIINYDSEGIISTYDYHVEGFKYWRISFYLSILIDNKIWLLPGMADESLCFDIDSKKMEKNKFFKSSFLRKEEKKEQYKYIQLERIGKNIFAFDGSTCQLECVNLDTNLLRRKKVLITNDSCTRMEIKYLMDSINVYKREA